MQLLCSCTPTAEDTKDTEDTEDGLAPAAADAPVDEEVAQMEALNIKFSNTARDINMTSLTTKIFLPCRNYLEGHTEGKRKRNCSCKFDHIFLVSLSKA